MRPLAVLIGIVMGSACALCVGLFLTWVTLLFLPRGDAVQLDAEKAPLVLAIGVFATLTGVAAVSFYGQIRERGWRHAANGLLLVALAGAVLTYWPRK